MPKYFGTSVIAIITLNVAIGYEVNVSAPHTSSPCILFLVYLL